MDLAKVILKGMLVRKKYLQATSDDSTPYSIDRLHEVISKITDMKIDFYEVDCDTHGIVKGLLNRYKYNADIYILKQKDDSDEEKRRITTCEQRFIAVKEMSHLIIDSPNTYTTGIDSLIKDITYNYNNLSDHHEKSEQKQSEELAEVIAAEILFPWEFRDECIRRIKEEGVDTLQIAKEYMFPLKKLEWVLLSRNHEIISSIHHAISNLGNGRS